MIFLKLSLLALMPLAVSIGMYLLEKKTKFANFEGFKKQILYGVIFGLLAISSTEIGQVWEIKINEGAILNCRDASVLIAGLVFGAPAGLISGFIGGIHRYACVLWFPSAKTTQLACSISTIVAGIIGAILRYFLFDNKKPSIFYALMIGFVVEVFHMLMVFFTNMGDIEKAFGIVQNATLPMVLINGFTVMLSVLVITLIGKEKVITHDHGTKTISTLFQRWLLITVLIAYVLTSTFTINMQFQTATANTEKLLSVNIADVKKDVEDASNKGILSIAENVQKDLKGSETTPPITIEQAVDKYKINEINIISAEDGVITQSTNSDFVGFDMDEKEGQSKDFLDKLNASKNEEDEKKKGKYVQPFGSISSDSDLKRKYAGVILDNGNYMQIGYDAEGFQQFVDPLIVSSVENRHVGKNGYLVVINSVGKIVGSGNAELKDVVLRQEYLDIIKSRENDTVIDEELEIGNDTSLYFCMFEETESYYIISMQLQSEANLARDLTIYISIFMEIIVFVSLFILIYLLVKNLVVNNIKKVNDSLAEITGGNLNVVVDVRANEEFASLSDDINATVDTLKHYIAEAAARLDKELQLAKVIQESSLPSLFPPFPERKEFDIFASMDPAKEVGGDFYDFYFLDDNHLAFLVADVSGKGITGAMFMMKAKTLIKSFSEQSSDVADILTKTNDALCEGNDAEMFVTCFMGIIDLTSGKIEFSNAGHNPPLIRHKNGTFEYFKGRTGFVLGGMEGLHYRKGEIDFEMGDTIFIYSDGVTEAVDVDTKMYTENRLYDKLNKIDKNATAETICKEVKNDLDLFVGEASQFDDITMLCLITKKLDSKKEENGNE